MIHFFHRSHAKKPETGLFSDWIGNNTDDLRCSVMSSEYIREFVMKFLPAQFACQFEKCLNRNFIH